MDVRTTFFALLLVVLGAISTLMIAPGVIGGVYLLGIMGLFLGPVLLAVFKAGLNVFSWMTLEGDERPDRAGADIGSSPAATTAPAGEHGRPDSDGAS